MHQKLCILYCVIVQNHQNFQNVYFFIIILVTRIFFLKKHFLL